MSSAEVSATLRSVPQECGVSYVGIGILRDRLVSERHITIEAAVSAIHSAIADKEVRLTDNFMLTTPDAA